MRFELGDRVKLLLQKCIYTPEPHYIHGTVVGRQYCDWKDKWCSLEHEYYSVRFDGWFVATEDIVSEQLEESVEEEKDS